MFKRAISILKLPHRRVYTLRNIATMDTVRVHFDNGDEKLEISLMYELPSGHARRFNFNRTATEELSVTLERMCNNLSSRVNKKSKKKGKSESKDETNLTDISMCLFNGDKQIDGSLTNEEAWLNGTTLKIGKTDYTIVLNSPKVHSLKLQNCVLAGYPVVPVVDVKNCNFSLCEFRWYIEKPKEENPSKKIRRSSGDSDSLFKYVSSGPTFFPRDKDIGFKLKVECIPSDGQTSGEELSVISKSAVMQGPGNCPFQKRHELTRDVCDNQSFRVVSYNILAEMYTESEYSRDFLFPQCSKEYLSMDYRKLLIANEILGYNADVICLQEVDKKVFVKTLEPLMNTKGFESASYMKASDPEFNNGHEGCAVFCRKSKFSIVAQHDVNLTDILKQDSELWEKLSKSVELIKLLEERNTIVQVCVLESKENKKKLLVATTHFFFHPRANHVRVLQTLACVRHLAAIRAKYNDEDVAVLFCGDLNAHPLNAVHQLLTTSQVPASHADWYSGGRKEFVPDMTLTSPFVMQSVYGPLPYTNYVTSFNGCLDYIYIEPGNLEKVREIPLPSHEDVVEHVCLPNKYFPSDHLALVADIKWKE